MAGYFAVLGNIVFETLTSPEEIVYTWEYHYAEHKVIEARPRLQWIFNELLVIELDMTWHVTYANPTAQMNRLRAAADAHLAMALVFGNGIHRGYFVIESIEETATYSADDGSEMAATCKVMLREWAPGIDQDPTVSKAEGKPPGIIISDQNVPFDPLAGSGPQGVPGSNVLWLTRGNVTYTSPDLPFSGLSAITSDASELSVPSVGPGSIDPSTIVRDAP